MGRVDSSGNIRLKYKSHTHGIAPCLSHIHRCAECVGQFQFARLDWNNLQYWELHDKYLWIRVIFKQKKEANDLSLKLESLNCCVGKKKKQKKKKTKKKKTLLWKYFCVFVVCVCVCV
jgi:hypothetical protein